MGVQKRRSKEIDRKHNQTRRKSKDERLFMLKFVNAYFH